MSLLYKGNPSVTPHKPFQPEKDVHALRAAMKGIGTDEKTIITIICRRTNEQLQIIQTNYKAQLGRDLYEDVRSETSGHFRDVLCALLVPRYKFYVNQLFAAVDGLGTNEDALIEVLCALTTNERTVVQANYLKDHKLSLEDALKSDTSGKFQRLLVSMCFVKRDECPADARQARMDAQDLINYPKVRSDADELLYNRLLTQRSFAHIRAINECCLQFGEADLQALIAKNFSGDLKNCLTAIVQFAINRAEFFAMRLHKSMAGLGTTDSQLIRLMVMRCEIDLADVSKLFEQIYGKTLVSFIQGDTSANYRRALLALLGEATE